MPTTSAAGASGFSSLPRAQSRGAKSRGLSRLPRAQSRGAKSRGEWRSLLSFAGLWPAKAGGCRRCAAARAGQPSARPRRANLDVWFVVRVTFTAAVGILRCARNASIQRMCRTRHLPTAQGTGGASELKLAVVRSRRRCIRFRWPLRVRNAGRPDPLS